MSVVEVIKNFLESNNVKYKEFHHRPVRTSEEACKIRPEYTLAQGAKAIIISAKFSRKIHENFMLVLPGDKRIDSKKVKKILGCKSFSFASEEEAISITKGVLPGGIPPFGNIFGLEVLVDPTLGKNDEIIFNAGERTISIAMKYSDYKALVNPQLVDIIK